MTEVKKITFNRKEGAAYVGLCENTFAKLLNSGSIAHIRVGRRILIPKLTLDHWIEQQVSAQ